MSLYQDFVGKIVLVELKGSPNPFIGLLEKIEEGKLLVKGDDKELIVNEEEVKWLKARRETDG